jgi:hypothetical protein
MGWQDDPIVSQGASSGWQSDPVTGPLSTASRAQAQNFGPKNILSTPFKLPASKGTMPDPAGPDPFDIQKNIDIPWDSKDQNLASRGIDITTGSPYALRSETALSDDPQEQLRAVRKYFQARGENVYPRVGPDSKEIEYLNPQTGRYTLLHNRQFLGEGPAPSDITGATLTTLGGAAAAPSFFGTAAGAGAGAMVNEVGKFAVKTALGLTTVGSGLHQARNILGEGAATAGAALVGNTIARIPSLIGYATKGVLPGQLYNWLKESPELISKVQDAFNNLKDYYNLAGNTGLKPDVASASGDPALQLMKSKALSTSENVQVSFKRQFKANVDNIAQTFQKVTNAYKSIASGQPGDSGSNIAAWAQQQKAEAQQAGSVQTKVAQNAATQAVAGYPTMSKDDIITRATGLVQPVAEAQKADVDKAYGDLNVHLGVPQEVAYSKDSDRLSQAQVPTIPFTLSNTGKGKLTNLLTEAYNIGKVDPGLRDSMTAAIPDGFLKREREAVAGAAAPADEDLFASLGLEPAPGKPTTQATSRFQINDDPKDLYAVLQSLQGLRTGTRRAMAQSKGILPPDEQTQARVNEIISKDIEQNFVDRNDVDGLNLYETAQQKARDYASQWRNGVLSEAVKKADGYTTPTYSSTIAHALFSSGHGADQRAITQLRQVLDGNPQSLEQVRQMIGAAYKDMYTNDGVPNPTLHAKFLSDFEGPLKQFMTPAEMSKIHDIGGLSDVLEASLKKENNFERAWNATTYGKLGQANTFNLSRAALLNNKNFSGIGNFLKQNNPELLQQLQRDTAAQVQARVFPQGGQFQLAKLGQLLDSSRTPGLREVMPPTYINDLKTLQGAAQSIGNNNEDFSPEMPLLKAVVRAVVGNFGKEGRTFTLFNHFRDPRGARAVYNAMADPDSLRKFMQAKDMSVANAARAGILTAVGARSFGMTNQVKNKTPGAINAAGTYLNQSNQQQQPQQ